jgi:hypothetical protein
VSLPFGPIAYALTDPLEPAGIVAIDRACMFNNDAESGAGMITVYGWIRQIR